MFSSLIRLHDSQRTSVARLATQSSTWRRLDAPLILSSAVLTHQQLCCIQPRACPVAPAIVPGSQSSAIQRSFGAHYFPLLGFLAPL